jgi:hypothetical protein
LLTLSSSIGRETTPSDRAARHVADPKDITLPRHAYRASSYDLTHQRLSVEPENDFLGEEGIDLGLDMGDMTGMEVDDHPGGNVRRRKGASESENGRFSMAAGGVASSSAFGYGPMNDLIDGLELGLDGFGDM